jgi:hypothetical protein
MREEGNILILHNDLKTCELYASNIKVYTNQTAVIFQNSEKALACLSKNKKIEIVVTKNNNSKDKDFQKIYETVRSINNEILVISLDGNNQNAEYPNAVFVEEDYDLKSVLRAVAKKKGITSKMMSDLILEDFYPFKTLFLLPELSYNVNIYLKIDNTFKLILDKNATLSKEQHDLILNKHDKFYIQSKDRLSLINRASSNIIEALRSINLDYVDQKNLTESGFELVQKTVEEIGVSKKTVALANATVEAMKKSIKSSKSIASLLDSLLNDHSSFKYKHSMLTIYIGTKVIQEAEEGSKQLLTKFCYIALFADISINDKLARIQSMRDFENSELTEKEQEQVFLHALQSALIVSKIKNIL